MSASVPAASPVALELLLCTQAHCTRRVVGLKRRITDAAQQEFNGPKLIQALQELIAARGLSEQVQVRQTSCMGGCTIGPRLNVVGAGGLKAAVRYLHLPAAKSHLQCARWADVASLEVLLDHHLQEECVKAREALQTSCGEL